MLCFHLCPQQSAPCAGKCRIADVDFNVEDELCTAIHCDIQSRYVSSTVQVESCTQYNAMCATAFSMFLQVHFEKRAIRLVKNTLSKRTAGLLQSLPKLYRHLRVCMIMMKPVKAIMRAASRFRQTQRRCQSMALMAGDQCAYQRIVHSPATICTVFNG